MIFISDLVHRKEVYADEICSGIAHGRVLTIEFYTYKRHKLDLLHFDIFTDLFRKDKLSSFLPEIYLYRL